MYEKPPSQTPKLTVPVLRNDAKGAVARKYVAQFVNATATDALGAVDGAYGRIEHDAFGRTTNSSCEAAHAAYALRLRRLTRALKFITSTTPSRLRSLA